MNVSIPQFLLLLILFGERCLCIHLTSLFMLAIKGDDQYCDQKVLDAVSRCKSARARNPSLDQSPSGPSFCLGLLEQGRKRYDQAIDAFSIVIDRCPDHGLAYYNIGSIYERLLQFDKSITAFRASARIAETRLKATVRLIPLLLRHPNVSCSHESLNLCSEYLQDHPNTLPVMELQAASHHKLGNYQKALKIYEETVTISNSSLKALLNAASAADCAGNAILAEKYYKQALRNYTTDSNAWTKYGCFLKYQGRENDAIHALRKAVELDPSEKASETSYAIIQLASLTGGLPRETMSISYVRELFNGYANKFDDELCNNLQYKGHEQVAMEIQKINDIRGEKLGTIIDLGCGTGLCGLLLKPHCQHLIGIDISEQMLYQAQHRCSYNRLELRESVEFLVEQKPSSIDGIVASDVFIYIGDLDDLFSAAAKALKSGTGVLVFTVEELTERLTFNLDSRRDYYLLPCGRFGHSKSYIYRLAARYGFSVKRCTEDILRTQNGSPVKSLTVSLLKESIYG